MIDARLPARVDNLHFDLTRWRPDVTTGTPTGTCLIGMAAKAGKHLQHILREVLEYRSRTLNIRYEPDLRQAVRISGGASCP